MMLSDKVSQCRPRWQVAPRIVARIVAWVALVVGAPLSAADPLDFNRDIRPILSNHCFQCHGPDAETREAELRLDRRDEAVKPRDGMPAIAPERPNESGLVLRIDAEDPSVQMPPPEFGKPLSAAQKKRLKQWILEGADYADHWAFQPPQVRDLPAPAAGLHARNTVDLFIQAELAARSIPPSPPAGRTTLIRRVHLDLLGLPPSWRDVRQFLDDDRPGAYLRMVDRALASPRLGERWGRHWLDQARYADSHGYTNDNERSIWPYRDWVIAAFNQDLPFDQFTIEQLAGDLLPEPTLAQRVATGFHRNTLINSEGGTKTDQFRDEQVKDRVDTTGLVWMGLTVGCAKCHAHKFDPISQQEYYELYAFFNSTADANSVTPTLDVPSVMQTRKLASLADRQRQLADRLANDDGRAQRQTEWESQLPARAAVEPAEITEATDANRAEPVPRESAADFPWTVVELSGKSLQGSSLRSQDDRSLLVSGKPQQEEEFHATARSPLTKIRSVRLEALVDDSLPQSGPGRAADGSFVLSEFWFRTGDGRELRFSEGYAVHSEAGHDISLAIDNKQETGWSIGQAPDGPLNQDRTAWFVLPQPLEVEMDHALTFKLQFHDADASRSLGRFRISLSDQTWVDKPSASQLAPIAQLPRAQRSKNQQAKLDKAFLKQDPVLGPVQRELQEVSQALEDLRRSLPSTMVLAELDVPRPTHVQVRGDFLRRAEPVSRATPASLPTLPTNAEEQRVDRLDLARWLVDPRHPLTSRVRVNRIWMRLFGRGLVATENDFGIQGTLPSHPELLDWLALEYQRQGWSTKRLLRLILNSATYRQSSAVTDEALRRDPENLWLGRQQRLRVEAEIVRDIALAASGQLGTTIGGPSVHPPQPDGVYAFTQRKKKWETGQGEDRYRRGMYTFFYRSAPYPMLSTFDTPKFNATCTRRDRSNTPLQSLTVANSEAMFELARRLAERVLRERPDTNDDRLARLCQLCLSRLPDAEERRILGQYLEQTSSRFEDETAVWTAVARVVLNLDETITRE